MAHFMEHEDSEKRSTLESVTKLLCVESWLEKGPRIQTAVGNKIGNHHHGTEGSEMRYRTEPQNPNLHNLTQFLAGDS
jgi:hypothetical protein